MPTQTLLFVDGHSAIFQWPKLLKLHQKRQLLGREALIQYMTHFQDQTGITVVIVFDGQGPKAAPPPESTPVQVFYSASNQTADSVIERLCAKYAPNYHVCVATDDFAERQTITAFGGHFWSIQELIQRVEDAERELTQEIRKHQRKRSF